MSIIYDLIFLVFALFCLPAYLFRRKFHVGFAARLGILPRGPLPRKPIWIHAVSVGEAASVIGLIDELRRVMPAAKFVISTVTPTGNKIASRLAGEGDLVTYLPLDLSFIVRRVIRKIDPTLFVIVETEVWPNLISALHAARVPVVTVNGRISEASFKGYLAAGVLFRRIFNKISLFCVQSARDASRLLRLGVAEDKIKVTGNMKFDAAGGFTIKAGELIKCRQLLGLLPQDKLLVCGSTHEGEEEALLRIYRAISEGFAGLKLLLAPRHPERSRQVSCLAVEYGFNPLAVSSLKDGAAASGCGKDVFILDAVGELVDYYAIADIIFVGGSLVNKGGHNILEPGFLEKPVLFGPHMSNFRDIAELFLENDAAIKAADEAQLRKDIESLLADPERCARLGSLARQVILQNQGATARNLEYLRRYCII